MRTEISVIIPQGYWGIVKRWLGRVARAPKLLEYPEPKVEVLEDGIVYTTASGNGQYIIRTDKTELIITFEGRRNSFRRGTPFLGFCWDGAYEIFGEVEVILRDVNAFAPEIIFLGHVDSFDTSTPEVPFFSSNPPRLVRSGALFDRHLDHIQKSTNNYKKYKSSSELTEEDVEEI